MFGQEITKVWSWIAPSPGSRARALRRKTLIINKYININIEGRGRRREKTNEQESFGEREEEE